MSTVLRFRDHAQFHRAALAMGILGTGAGALGQTLWGSAAAPSSLAMLTGVTLAVALQPRGSHRALPLGVAAGAVLAGVAALVPALAPAHWRALLLGLGMAAAALCWRPRGMALWLSLGTVGAVLALAHRVAVAVAGGQELASLPPWTIAGLAGAAFAFTGVLALLPRHLSLVRDRVAAAHAVLAPRLAGELGELVARAHREWRSAAGGLPEDDEHRRVLEESLLRLLDVAARWSAIESDDSRPRAEALAERLAELDRRHQAATDEVVREQYAQARAALGEQLRHLREIDTSRERLLARVHNYVAAMERLRVAVVNLRSARISRSADEVAPLVSTLEELGQEMDSASAAAAEIDRL